MKLIADSGSTKTAWCLIRKDGGLRHFLTEGYNPFFVKADEIHARIGSDLPKDLPQDSIEAVDFYGAGCLDDKAEVMTVALQGVFKRATIQTHLDLLGAARSLLGTQAGFAAILGTGTNTCLYDGESITGHIDSLGYILGDEGSGSAMGGRLLGDYIRGYMPADIEQKFFDVYRLTSAEILDHVYSQPHASRFCAGFTHFLSQENLKSDYLHNIVSSSFHEFFQNLVRHYPSYQDYTFNCVGSVGYSFRHILREVALEFGMETGNVVSSPMPGLVQYHTGSTILFPGERMRMAREALRKADAPFDRRKL